MVPALAHGAMGHGLLKPIVSPSCACAKGGGQDALRLFEMAKGVVARVTSRIDVCTDLKIEAALGQDGTAKNALWVILVTLEAESSEVTMTGTLFLGGTARRKSSGARSQVCRSVSGPTRRPSCA